MRPYLATLDDVTAGFPDAVYTPEDIRDPGEFTHSETLSAIEAPYLYRLAYLPARFPVPVVTVDGAARTVVPYSPLSSPSAGQVAMAFDGVPFIEFAANDGSETDFDVSYMAIGSVPAAELLNRMQKELVAAQEAAALGSTVEHRTMMFPGAPAASDLLGMIIVDPRGKTSRTVNRVILFAADISAIGGLDGTYVQFTGITSGGSSLTVKIPSTEETSSDNQYLVVTPTDWTIDTSAGAKTVTASCFPSTDGHADIHIELEIE